MDQIALDKKQIIRLSAVFALIYFFSPNGLAALPGLTVSFLLKDVLKMTAEQAAYFAAITIVGWAIKPLWGIISDTFPVFGYRRKSYLIFTSVFAAAIWLVLGRIENYSTSTLILLFSLSSVSYAFMDVLCDALMIERGKAHNLTGRFQSIQWTAVYVASIFAALGGGWVAEHLKPQTVFSLNGIFPVIILAAALLFIHEEKNPAVREQIGRSWQSLKTAFGGRTLWLLGFFLFFLAFSPSFGAPFFYYSVDNLKFSKFFLGAVGAVGSAAAALGAVLYSRYYRRFETRPLIKAMIVIGVVATLSDLVYFTPPVTQNLFLARAIYVTLTAILGVVGAFTFLTMMNAAALATPRYSEGTTFAVLTSFWNVGLMGSAALGGFLFGKIGLQPLIIVSAVFTAAAWFILPYLKFADELSAG